MEVRKNGENGGWDMGRRLCEVWRLESGFNGGLEVGREWDGLRGNERSGKFFLKFLGLYFRFRGLTATSPRRLVAVGCSLTSGVSEILMPTATRP